MLKKLLRFTLCIIPCVSLLPLKLNSAVLPPAPKANILLSWDYPADQLGTNLWFKIYHTTNLSEQSTWTVLTNVIGTNLSVSLPMEPGAHFFTLSASNALGESAFATTSF